MEKFDREKTRAIVKGSSILFVSFVLILVVFNFFDYHFEQKKLISEFKNTNIKERLIINNKQSNMNKPYKLREGTIYIPVLELCKNFNTDASYVQKSGGVIELTYKKSTYILKLGSNEVRYKGNKEVLKMDGITAFMDNTIYVPKDFIYKVLDVNVTQGGDGTVYMDNYPKKFNYSWVSENRYIAHALGGVDGYTYTNSKEALEKSYERGIRVMETDITPTSDGKLVLVHSFDAQGLSELGLPTSWAKNNPTEKEFLDTKILGRYHTMSFKQLCEYMKEHEDMYVVIDLKKNDLKEVEKMYKLIVSDAKSVDKKILNRIIPQIYYEAMYKPIMNIYDFKSMIYTTYRIEDVIINRIVDFSYEHGIKIVAADKFNFSKELSDKLVDRGMGIYMFTYNDQSKVNSLSNQYVSGFYTDFLPKGKIERDSEGKVVVNKNSQNQDSENNQDTGKVE